MAENTKIQWTTHSWSPWHGCAKISPGCEHCYAAKGSLRNPAILGVWGKNGKRPIKVDWDAPLRWDRKAAKLGERHRVFPSLCDPFEDRPDLVEPRARFFDLIHATPNLDWLVLTKRPENWRPILDQLAELGHCPSQDWFDGHAPANLWLGVSVENQEYADKRIPTLLEIPAAIRWVSYEPALGLVNFGKSIDVRNEPGGYDTLNPLTGGMWGSRTVCGGSDRRIDWIVCGGESGPNARPFHLEWAQLVRDQCKRTDVAFFMKQIGGNPVVDSARHYDSVPYTARDPKGGDIDEFPPDLQIREFPLKGGTL